MNSKVTIVIPTFNRANYLEKCVESCLSQTHPCEIIVCDHGSTDNTPTIMQKYTDNVRYIRRENDFGPHFCWLEGVINAKNEWIHINYDDDWIEETFIEKTFDLVDESIGFVFTNAKIYDENKNEFNDWKITNKEHSGCYISKDLVNYFLKDLAVSPGCMLLRKQVILDNLFTGKLPLSNIEYRGVGPDMLFSIMSTINYSKIGYVNEYLAIFRSHDMSITIDSMSDKSKNEKIKKSYNEAKKLYYLDRINFSYKLIKLLYKILKKLNYVR
jgi:glycosyltransferase involved in cell wall biosynthesis